VISSRCANSFSYSLGLPFRINTVHLMILIALQTSIFGRGLAWRGRSGKLLILRLTARKLRRLRLEMARSSRISSRTAL
jgi:hypothetical protein